MTLYRANIEARRNALETAAAVADQFVNDLERSAVDQELARLIARLIRDKRQTSGYENAPSFLANDER